MISCLTNTTVYGTVPRFHESACALVYKAGPGNRAFARRTEHQDPYTGRDALGNPLGFFLTGGEAHDLVGADHLLPTMAADTLIADKAFDADARVLEPLAAASKTAVIPPRTNRSSLRNYDRPLYGERHLIENFFAKIKQFRAIATRYEKTARNFLAAVQLGMLHPCARKARQLFNRTSPPTTRPWILRSLSLGPVVN